MKIAVVGATGMVGRMMLKILAERNFPVKEIIVAATEKSVGKTLLFDNQEVPVVNVKHAIKEKPKIALFSAGSQASLQYAPLFARSGTYVIDNSSAWRMDSTKKLIIPEINARILNKEDRIIANPNCSTIQLLMVLAPLHIRYGIKRVVVSTYQSVTGTGLKAVQQLESEENHTDLKTGIYPHPIHRNCLPHCGDFGPEAYTEEELKLVRETHKILDPKIRLTATAVRVPVIGGHSESVNIEFKKSIDLESICSILSAAPGVQLLDNPKNNEYPMPITSADKDTVFVGRIRQDMSRTNSINLWITADNLRKGAATNAIQIAEYLTNNIL